MGTTYTSFQADNTTRMQVLGENVLELRQGQTHLMVSEPF